MNKIYLLLVIVLGLGKTSCQINNAHATPNNPSTQNKVPFDFQFEIESLDDNQYFLVATLELGEEDYTISPLSPDTFYMHVGVHLEATKNLVDDNTLIEIPASKPEIDPILNYPVHFVRGKTTYKKKLEVTSKNDFEINGMMEFLLEPICIPYQVKFIMEQNAEKLSIKNIEAKIAPSYKGK